jgi:hypothetical protein
MPQLSGRAGASPAARDALASSPMHRSRLAGFIIDCRTDDVPAAGRFWSGALGLPVVGPDGSGYERLDASTRDLVIEVQGVPHESRVHVDIETDDVDAEVARLEALGAKRVEHVKTWCVMQSPTGQRFCVVRRNDLENAKGVNVWVD